MCIFKKLLKASSSAQSRLSQGAENEKKNDSSRVVDAASSTKINLNNIVITGNNSDSVNSDIGESSILHIFICI